MGSVNISRCFKPQKFCEIIDYLIYLFLDASEKRYGQSSYSQLVDKNGSIHCVLLVSEFGVAAFKYVSIPSLELTAANLSIKILRMLQEEIDQELT